jgi:hypothetical protein
LSEALKTRDEEPHVGLVTNTSLEEAAHRLGDALRMTTSHQNESSHGYEMFCGASKRRGSTSQFWISRNEVPRGYVGQDDEEYRDTLGLLPGTALRHRDHPECTLIVEVRDLALADLLAALERAGLPAREI